MREGKASTGRTVNGPTDLALLASFVVNAVRWNEKVTVAGKPLKLIGTWKDEQKSNLRAAMTKNPKMYEELYGDFKADIDKFKAANPRSRKRSNDMGRMGGGFYR